MMLFSTGKTNNKHLQDIISVNLMGSSLLLFVSEKSLKKFTDWKNAKPCHSVLGSARPGLIFTRIQEGTQLGGLTQPAQTEQGVSYHVPSCCVLVGGSWAAGNLSRLWNAQRAVVSESCSACSATLCCVFSLSVSLFLLFPLFAVLLNCPYPHPSVSACFFPFSSTPQQGEGQPCGAFVAGHSQTITHSNCLLSSRYFSTCKRQYMSLSALYSTPTFLKWIKVPNLHNHFRNQQKNKRILKLCPPRQV